MNRVKYIYILPLLIVLFHGCFTSSMGLETEYEAGLLANDYAKDIKSGNKKYKGEYLTISGKIAEHYKNKYDQKIILLMDKKQVNGIKCILNSSSKQLKKPLKLGSNIRINGRCSGFNEYVILERCIILK